MQTSKVGPAWFANFNWKPIFGIGNNKISNVLYTTPHGSQLIKEKWKSENNDGMLVFLFVTSLKNLFHIFIISYFHYEMAVLYLISIQGFWGFELDGFLRCEMSERKEKFFAESHFLIGSSHSASKYWIHCFILETKLIQITSIRAQRQ